MPRLLLFVTVLAAMLLADLRPRADWTAPAAAWADDDDDDDGGATASWPAGWPGSPWCWRR